MTRQRLTVFLLRDVAELDDALSEDAASTLDSHDLSASTGLVGRFYSRRNPPKDAAWVRFVQPIVENELTGLRSASASGLLLLKVDERVFALTFGYGRSFLDPAKLERRFGLKVALNLIEDNHIRSLDTKTFDEMVVSKTTQASRTSDLPTFGVDIMKDMLRAVTGSAPPTSRYTTIAGSDALVVAIKEAAIDLPGVLSDLHSHYTSTKYQSQFGWVDHMDEVRDPSLIEELDTLLVEQLRCSETSTTHMAMPENLDWEDIEHFEIVPTRRHVEFEELDLDKYLAHPATGTVDLTVDQLKRRKVLVKFLRSAEPDARWSVYQCLVSEQRANNALYALVEGRWFSIADSLVAEVDGVVAAIPPSTVTLPPGLPGESEGDYNVRAAATCGELALLDRALVAPDGAPTRLEFCDLISTDGSLVHVKRKSRSSTLSHLFAQGHVSAEAMADAALRSQVRTAIEMSVGDADPTGWLAVVPPGDQPAPRDKITVTYAVIASSSAEGVGWLSFFSRLALMQTVRGLNRLGFTKVALSRIPIADSAAQP